MKVLVTGASGMLGRSTAQALLDRGDDVTVLQRGAAGLPAREVRGDIADPEVVRRAAAGAEVVVHLAARVDVVGPWGAFERANVLGTRTVLAACRAVGVRRLVQVSSPSVAHAGGALVGAGAGPADPSSARGHYARSKAVSEQEALAADGADLAVLAIRPHLVWGPGDTQLVGRVAARARAGRLPLLGTGAALIDTTYVSNAVDALVCAVDARAHGTALVVSNGEPRPVAEVLAAVCRAVGAPPPTRRVPRAVGLVAGSVIDGVWAALDRRDTPPLTRFLVEQLTTAHWFDQRRTRELLAWAPRVTLDEGFAVLSRHAGVADGGGAHHAVLSPGR